MNLEERLRKKAEECLEDSRLLIGYSHSNLPLKISTAFLVDKSETGDLIFNRYCINNLASYIYSISTEVEGKIGLILKPCDSRSIIQLLSEGLLDRERIRLIVVGCGGIVDYKKIQKHLEGRKIISAEIREDEIRCSTADKEHILDVRDFYADKCYWCDIHDNPPICDDFIENKQKPDVDPKEKYEDVENLEKMSPGQIESYWNEQFESCIRCYACRNICPLEICRDRCITDLDSPYWQSQRINSQEGKFFQLIRVMHLAGRCTECGECQRVCPKNIPLSRLMKKSAQITEKLFDYRAGEEVDDRPPLLTFKDVEKNIEEEKLV